MRIGLSSYSYSWEVGASGQLAQWRLPLEGLAERASSLGADVLQVADNLPLHTIDADHLARFGRYANDLGLRIEVGTRRVDPANLSRYVPIAAQLSSPFLRVMAETDRELSPDEAVEVLGPQRELFERSGVRLAIENHDHLTSAELAGIVTRLGTSWAGVCLDTSNSFGALEGPEVVISTLRPFVLNVHVKDFTVQRIKHVGFTIEGRPVGKGRLDVPWLLSKLDGCGEDVTAVIELWTPPEPEFADTVAKERAWAAESIKNLRDLMDRPAISGKPARRP
ncbi:MAG TPA: sugar phosphate isomerase/epimerase family protein [Trebonia sp.]|jgi:sugar phosphate isomerase/epimerase|nr:sugar phosphate isomerase/epimerase family protein [Trebonia sp.]